MHWRDMVRHHVRRVFTGCWMDLSFPPTFSHPGIVLSSEGLQPQVSLSMTLAWACKNWSGSWLSTSTWILGWDFCPPMHLSDSAGVTFGLLPPPILLVSFDWGYFLPLHVIDPHILDHLFLTFTNPLEATPFAFQWQLCWKSFPTVNIFCNQDHCRFSHIIKLLQHSYTLGAHCTFQGWKPQIWNSLNTGIKVCVARP